MRFEKEVTIYGDETVLKRFKAAETSIAVVQGNISAIISESELIELVNSKATMYSKLASAVMDIKSLTINFSDLTTKYNTVSGQYSALDSKVAQYKLSVDGLSVDIAAVQKDLNKNYSTTTEMNAAIKANVSEISAELYAVKTNLSNNYSTTSAMNAAIKAKVDALSLSVSYTYSKKSDLTAATSRISTLETWRKEASLQITDSAIVSTVISSYSYKNSVKSMITQTADEIRLKADKISWSSTYSSMTSNGKLTCKEAEIQGEFRSEYSGPHGLEHMHIKEGRLLGGINGDDWGVLDLAAQYEGTGRHILLAGGDAVLHLRGMSIQLHGNTYGDGIIKGKLQATNGETKSIPVITGINIRSDGEKIVEVKWTTKMMDVQNGIVINIQD